MPQRPPADRSAPPKTAVRWVIIIETWYKYDVHDPEGASLVLRVSSDGRKTGMACYGSPTGVMQFRAIGKYPLMSIAEAREKARSVVSGAQNSEADG